MIEGLSHVTVIVRDLVRMTRLIVEVLGGCQVYASGAETFSIAGELERCRAALARLGLEVRESRPRDEGEGQSLYFYDDDNHLFERHSGTLDERLRRYAQGKTAPVPA
ncbi:MAG: FosX/FosE/FosI family fosfomycin resistance thiol transferase [Alphaproteobacteria bacterium]